MAAIVIINGTFGSGKTALKNVLIKSIFFQQPQLPIQTVADGPHLVYQIKDLAHPIFGLFPSSSHSHAWTKNKHHHFFKKEGSHFPFTVTERNIGDRMFETFLNELWLKSQEVGLIVAELGTGKVGNVSGNPDFSTKRFLEIAKKQPYWDELKKKIRVIITVAADWKKRIKNNPNRPQITDGINLSWQLQLEAMEITREPDFAPWQQEFSHKQIVHCKNEFSNFREPDICRLRELILMNMKLKGENEHSSRLKEF